MGVAQKKLVKIKFITFDEFVEYGKEHAVSQSESGVPWAFSYEGYPITHETDTSYVIPTMEGNMMFTPDDVLITGVKGEIYLCKIDIFKMTYDVLE